MPRKIDTRVTRNDATMYVCMPHTHTHAKDAVQRVCRTRKSRRLVNTRACVCALVIRRYRAREREREREEETVRERQSQRECLRRNTRLRRAGCLVRETQQRHLAMIHLGGGTERVS